MVHFIGSPLIDSEYATPGAGNVSSDGVHPSTQGCKCDQSRIGGGGVTSYIVVV
jgi:hypothetical protein